MQQLKPFSQVRLHIRYFAVAACLIATPALDTAAADTDVAWELEQTVGVPSYAAVSPIDTNLNIESVVLACEQTDNGKVLQLQLYLTAGALSVKAVGPPRQTHHPRAEIAIDNRVFPTSILFADDYVVVANEKHGLFPMLSHPLLDAMARGRTMVLRLPVDAEPPGGQAVFDGEAVIDLQAGQGSSAVRAVRRCAEPNLRVRISLNRPRTRLDALQKETSADPSRGYHTESRTRLEQIV